MIMARARGIGMGDYGGTWMTMDNRQMIMDGYGVFWGDYGRLWMYRFLPVML